MILLVFFECVGTSILTFADGFFKCELKTFVNQAFIKVFKIIARQVKDYRVFLLVSDDNISELFTYRLNKVNLFHYNI